MAGIEGRNLIHSARIPTATSVPAPTHSRMKIILETPTRLGHISAVNQSRQMTATKNDKSKFFCKKGNTAGFTKDGIEVTGKYESKTQTWTVWTHESLYYTKKFGTAKEADEYAASQIDPEMTAKKKWW